MSSAQLASDIQALCDRLLNLYFKIRRCDGHDYPTVDFDILTFPFEDNAGTLFYNYFRLEYIREALGHIINDANIRSAVAADRGMCGDVLEDNSSYMNCYLESMTSSEHLALRGTNVLSYTTWLNNCNTVLDYIETLYADYENDNCPQTCIPDSCPSGLDDEYDVVVCGHTITVSRASGSSTCFWDWSVGGLTGCGMTLEYITLSLDPGVAWELMIEQGDPYIPESYEACYYTKDNGCIPSGGYSLLSSTGENSCDSSAEVEEST